MAKAPSLRKDWTKGTQRTRKLSTGNALWRLRKWEGTLRGASGSRRKIAGVKPGAVKAASPVLNGGDEETGLCRPRLVATQLECEDCESDTRAGPLHYDPTRSYVMQQRRYSRFKTSSLYSVGRPFGCFGILFFKAHTHFAYFLSLLVKRRKRNWH